MHQGKKFDKGKTPVQLVPWEFIQGLGKVLGFGASKYAAWNWAKGMNWDRLIRAAQDHLGKWSIGDAIDKESGENHLLHAACCIMFLYMYQLLEIGKDNRWIRPKKLKNYTQANMVKSDGTKTETPPLNSAILLNTNYTDLESVLVDLDKDSL